MLALIVVAIGGAAPPTVSPAVSLTGAYTQNFDSLANTAGSTTNTSLPVGWMIGESGGGARDNGQYAVDTGAGNTGDTYSYGAAGSTERALGSLRSGTLVPTIGARFSNGGSDPITSLDVAYRGEEWRLGTAARTDQLDFQYSLDATDLTTGTWTDVNSLDFVTPDTVTTGAKNGNAAPDRTAVAGAVTGLNLPAGAEIWIRWVDADASGADDGLAVDDFSLTPHAAAASTSPSGSGAATPSSVAQGGSTTLTVTVTPGTSPASTGLAVTGDLSSIGGGSAVAFQDNGDGTFSTAATVAAATSTGAKSIPFTVTDGQSRSGSGSIALTVTAGAGSGPDLTGLVISQVYGGGGNSSAPYTNDYIELFNPTSSAITVTGASVQYTSSGGSGTWATTPLTGSVGAHRYYLVQEAAGAASPAPLPTPDATGTIAMSGTAGKVALVASTTALSGSCPTTNRADLVGYGTADCFEGAGAAPAPSNTTADFRANGGCTDTNVNSADFSTGAPAPRNSANQHSCTAPLITCPANATIAQGATFARTVTASDTNGHITSIGIASVSPGSGASSFSVTGFTASGNSASATVRADNALAPGTYTVSLQASDDDSPPQTSTCSFTLTVNGVIPIGQVQGAVPATGDPTAFESPLKGQTVTVQGVVTELTFEGGNHGFYLQNTPAKADADPTSSDGIFVFMSTHTDLVNGYVPHVGDEIVLTGTVSEFFDQTELGSASATVVPSTGAITPFDANPPADPTDAARYWEQREGMFASVPTASVVDSPTHFYSSTGDTEFYALNPTSSVATRANPYAQRIYRGTAHPFSGSAGELILVTDEGIKTADPNARLTPVHTYQRLTTPVTGGVYFDFGKYSVSASAQPQVGGGVDPSQDDAPPAFDRSQAYSIANFNMENLYDYRDDPTDGCDFDGNSGCQGVTPPFDYTPADDATYQGREGEIATQIVNDLHSPDVIVVQEAEDQDICSVTNGAMDCGAALNNPDGKPDVLEELALKVKALNGVDYDTAFDRNGADARGIICAFMFRSDRVSLIPATAGDPVLGSSPQVQYRGAPLGYDSDVSNPKALNAVLPSDVDTSTGVDGSNVFTRAVQVAHFRIAPTTAAGSPSDIWVQANHFTSNPDASVGQRKEQAAYNAAVVKAIQSGDPNAKVMVAGDLNVYPLTESDQLQSLADAGLHDLYDTVLANNPASAYSYSFTGMAQDLDHQFVTQSFFDDLNTVNEAHINSDWTRVPGSNRGTSDHDPMVSQWKLKLDTAPTVDAGGPYAVDEGGTATLTATADDPDAGDTVTYAWDLDGDGTFETPAQTVMLPAPDGPVTKTVTVKATDSFGLSSTDTATVTIRNVAPTAQFSASGSVTAGDSVTLSLTNPADPSAADTAAGFEYAFDCGNGYGAFSTTSTATCPATQRGTLHVGGEIRDKDGGVREYRSDVTVNGRSPIVSAGGPYTVDEGGTVTLTATGSDPDGDTITYAWNLDGDSTYETSGNPVTFHAGDGPATVTVSVQATDSTGATATSSATITVRNVAPTATFNAPAKATVGVPFTISLTAPHDYDTALQYAFDCGDGTGFGPFGAATSATCTSITAGALVVRGEVQDKDGAITAYSKTVTVGVTFDGICAVAKQLASTSAGAKQFCDDLARAAAAKNVGQKTAALVAAAADLAKGVLRGTWTVREAAEIAKLIAKL